MDLTSISWRDPPRSVRATLPFKLRLFVERTPECLAEYSLSEPSRTSDSIWHSETTPRIIERGQTSDLIEWEIRIDVPGEYAIDDWQWVVACQDDLGESETFSLPSLRIEVESNLGSTDDDPKVKPRPIDQTLPAEPEPTSHRNLLFSGMGLLIAAVGARWFLRRRRQLLPARDLQHILDQFESLPKDSAPDALAFLRNESARFIAIESGVNVASSTTDEIEGNLSQIGWQKYQIDIVKRLWKMHSNAVYADAVSSRQEIESLTKDLQGCLAHRIQTKRSELFRG